MTYGVQFDQIAGPDWIETQDYDISAIVPPGATKEQVDAMWRNLLEQRFHLALHTETRNFPVYELSLAKNGPKLSQSADTHPPKFSSDQQTPRGAPTDGRGFPILPPGKRFGMAGDSQVVRLSFRAFSMAEFIDRIGWPLGNLGRSWLVLGRIVDKTGLTGRYDFTLEYRGSFNPGGAFPPPPPEGEPELAPELLPAIERQLGLKLTPGHAPLKVIVLDHADRIPVEN
jgi:uncharacterized protein (TIGR03435 family)